MPSQPGQSRSERTPSEPHVEPLGNGDHGVYVPGARRILYRGDPGEAEFLAATEEVEQIRSALSDLRHRLYMLYATVDRGHIPADSTALAASGAISCAIRSLHDLVAGDHSFVRRAELSRELWDHVAANPDSYIVKDGKHERL